jgi:predicted metal-dependent peptidase
VEELADEEFKAFVGHIESIRKNVKIEKITLVPFNSIILQDYIVELAPRDKFPKELRTGGGTAFAPIFNWVRRQKKTPDGIIIFTDLCCEDYGEPARTSILWASTDEVYKNYQGWYTNHPPFGEVVQVDISQD